MEHPRVKIFRVTLPSGSTATVYARGEAQVRQIIGECTNIEELPDLNNVIKKMMGGGR